MKARSFQSFESFELQGSKLTLVRWPVTSGFPVGPVESVMHWPGWPVKFYNPSSEFTWFSVNFSFRINQYILIKTLTF